MQGGRDGGRTKQKKNRGEGVTGQRKRMGRKKLGKKSNTEVYKNLVLLKGNNMHLAAKNENSIHILKLEIVL